VGSINGVVSRLLQQYKVTAETTQTKVENSVTIENSHLTTMAWMVSVILSQTGIKGVSRVSRTSFEYNNEYFMFVLNKYNGKLDIVPLEHTDAYKECMDLFTIDDPGIVEDGTIDLSARLMNQLLTEKNILGIVEEGDEHRRVLTYDKRYFKQHYTLENEWCIYVRSDTPEYQEFLESELFKENFEMSGETETVVNSTISRSNSAMDILLKIKGITGLRNYSENDVLVTEYNTEHFYPYKNDDDVSVLFIIDNTEEHLLLSKIHLHDTEKLDIS